MNENVNHKLVVCGDVHLQDKEPKKSNAIDTLNWIFNQEFNNENNSILFLGDLVEINSPFECFEIFVDYFVNRSKFEKIFILQGNHDAVNQSTVLSLFRPLKNVEIITDWKAWKFYNCNLLFLPFYNHESTDKKPMTEVYSNLYENEEIKNTELHFGFGHIEDHTNHFSKKFCDTSKLKVEHWFNGHIHTNDSMNNGNYLGSACMNSVIESGHKRYILSIDGQTRQFGHIEIPNFMEYYEVSYPNPLPKIDTKYGIFLVRDAIDKNTVIEEYSKQAEKLGYKFYCRKVLTKKSKNLELDEVEKSDKPTFDGFCKSVGLKKEVEDICRQVINLKGE